MRRAAAILLTSLTVLSCSSAAWSQLTTPDGFGAVATMALAMPEDPEELGEAIIAIQWTMGVASKFWWPIPDRGLDKRIHRITADTLVIWGKEDKIISPEYAADFARLIKSGRAEVLDNAAHVPQLERYDVVPDLVTKFLTP